MTSASGSTALFCRKNIARTEKINQARSAPNEAASAGDACPPHGKFRCLELHLQLRGKNQITEFGNHELLVLEVRSKVDSIPAGFPVFSGDVCVSENADELLT